MALKLSSGKIFGLVTGFRLKKFSLLYSIVRKKNVTVAHVLSTMPLNMSFRGGGGLVGDNWDEWLKLVESLLEV
jgi:uncharacterized membrane protein (Fun14 family)